MPFTYSDCRNKVNFSDVITFTRASEKNVFDRFGQLQTVASGQPAFSFDPVTGERKGIDVEEQRTNLNTRSSVSESLVVQIGGTSNYVTNSAGFFGLSGATFEHQDESYWNLSGTFAYTAGDELVVWIYCKPSGDINNWELQVSNVGNWVSAAAPKNSIDLGDGIYLFWGVVEATASGVSTVRLFDDGAALGETIEVVHVQVEKGTFPTSPIFTNGSTLTRAADVAVIQNLDTKPWWNPQEGTFVVELSRAELSSNVGFFSIGSDALTRVTIYILNGTDIALLNRDSGSAISDTIFSGYDGGRIKIAFKYKFGEDVKVSVNGQPVVTTRISATVNSANLIAYSNLSGLSNPSFNVGLTSYIPAAVSDAQLQQLSGA